MRSYHLWLVPPEPLHGRLIRLIHALGRRYGAPSFEPHVTLLGGLSGSEAELLARLSRLGRHLRPLPILLTEPDFRERYFQCLYLTVTPTRPLLETHETARLLFEAAPGARYVPHLSLLYGWFPVSVKEQVISALPRDLAPSFVATAVHLIRAESDDPKDWHRVASARCGG